MVTHKELLAHVIRKYREGELELGAFSNDLKPLLDKLSEDDDWKELDGRVRSLALAMYGTMNK